MEKEDDITFSSRDTQIVASDLNVELKRKRVAEVNYSAKRIETRRENCKHSRDGNINKESIRGSVLYQSLSPEVYEWPLKVSVQETCNIERSGLPSRFMYYEGGDWKDFRECEFALICDSFRARKSLVELFIDGKRYLVNLLQMFQLNLLTGYLRSVAWIDEHGKCFFPNKLVEGNGTWSLSQLRGTFDRQYRPTETDFNAETCVRGFDSGHDSFIRNCSEQPDFPLANVSVEIQSEKPSDSRVGVEAVIPAGRATHDFALLGDKVIKLDQGDQKYAAVRNRFLAGLGMLAPYVTITGIYQDTHTSTSGQGRLQSFRKQEEFTRKARGDANVKYAWHGTSKHGVSGIILHGFGQPKTPKNGATFGVGVYLAPESYSHVSAVYSDVDENSEQHMVFCEVIMGSMEQVIPGSEQFHPSNEDYDTGVDDICNPKRYIVWSTHMNTHILPQHIISFKLPSQWHGVIASLRGKHSAVKSLSAARGHCLEGRSPAELSKVGKVGYGNLSPCTDEIRASSGHCKSSPRSPWMSFPRLFLMMKSKIPPVNMVTLHRHYYDFKVGMLARDAFIKILRAVAGDRILVDCIESMQVQVTGSLLSSNEQVYMMSDHTPTNTSSSSVMACM